MRLGIDPSTYFEVEEKRPHYFVDGKEVEPLSYFHDENGVAYCRIRLWVDPYDENRKPYRGGTLDFPAYVKLAKLAMAKGYEILLDFHYSDFWVDPHKQTVPKSWRGLSVEELKEKVYSYTKEVLLASKKEGIKLHGVQIGNEITNGMLWPFGQLIPSEEGKPRSGYENLCAFLKNASKAVREVAPEAKIVIHLEKSYDVVTYNEFFDQAKAHQIDFDVIGLSYYPYWHGTFDMFFRNVENLKSRYHKPLWVVENAYGFTLEASKNGYVPLINEPFFQQENTFHPYPLTPEGQKQFFDDFLKKAEEEGIEEVYYWEPFWLPLDGLEWASKNGEAYIGETDKKTHNEWANQTLFDYEGNALPALFSFKSK